MKEPRVIVLCGDGLNCERETAHAFTLAGAQVAVIHVNDLLAGLYKLEDFCILAIPGGFSFGDDLGSGLVLATKLKTQLKAPLERFIQAGKLIIGICNGFQVLSRLGLLPAPFKERVMALAPNRQGHFINQWVKLRVEANSPCVWTWSLGGSFLELPMRHGEGRVVFELGREQQIFNKLKEAGQLPLFYTEDVNGSYAQIAGVCDVSGRILGLMPHPEAFVSNLQHPVLGQSKERMRAGLGLEIFKNAVSFARENLC